MAFLSYPPLIYIKSVETLKKLEELCKHFLVCYLHQAVLTFYLFLPERSTAACILCSHPNLKSQKLASEVILYGWSLRQKNRMISNSEPIFLICDDANHYNYVQLGQRSFQSHSFFFCMLWIIYIPIGLTLQYINLYSYVNIQ